MSEETTVQTDAPIEVTPEVTAPEAAPVQGDATSETSGLYSLDSIPEHLRAEVEPLFKEFDGNVTKEFQKRAEQLNAFKPYEELGLTEWAPEDVGKLIAFGQLASDEDKFKEWVKQAHDELYGGEAETPPVEAAPAAEAAAAQAEAQGLSPDAARELFAELRDQERQQEEATRQQEQQVEQTAATIRTTLDALKGQHGEYDEETVLMYAEQAQDATSVEDAIQKGYARLARLLGKTEQGVLQEKLDQKPSPEKGGLSDATTKPPTTFEEAAARTTAAMEAEARM